MISKHLLQHPRVFKNLLRFVPLLLAALLLIGCSSDSDSQGSTPGNTNQTTITHEVRLETSLGDITLGLYGQAAPASVNNFIGYVEAGFYDGLLFHRVIKDFMIQGGGFDPNFETPTLNAAIVNESNNGLSNRTGTLAMARTSAPDSAQSQFFINTVDNPLLDYRAATDDQSEQWGYAVFGEVTQGMDVVRSIESQPTGTLFSFQNLPLTPIVIQRALVVSP